MAFIRQTKPVFYSGLAVFLLLVATVPAVPSYAEDDPQIVSISVEPPDPVKETIMMQLKAIRERDAELAFSFMDEHLHDKYDDDADSFLAYLRYDYRAIYNHEDYSFAGRHHVKDALVQKVAIEDRGGKKVTAIFKMKEQDDGRWLIDSFAVLDFEADPI